MLHNFLYSAIYLAKTDAIDAKVLTHFGDGICPEVRQVIPIS